MNTLVQNPSRRQFLQISVAAGGGLLVGFLLPSRTQAAAQESASTTFRPNAFIRIAPNDEVTLVVSMA